MAIGRIDERRHVHHEIIAALRFEPLALAVSHPDLATYLDFACRIAVDAGTAILPHFRSALAVDDKGRAGVYDPVTEADRAAETTIREAIVRAYPDHGIRGEEHGWRKGTSSYTWVIDPIDGTRSFIIGQLHWGTLIALNDGVRPVVGVMHQPYVGETFTGIRGGVAQWRRGELRRALSTRPCATLSEARLACTHPEMFQHESERCAFERIAAKVCLTRFGGDCYQYCLLAAGLIDIVIESSLEAYDVQALMPIVDAAGGVMTSWTGGPCDEGGAVVACGDSTLHQRVLELLAQ